MIERMQAGKVEEASTVADCSITKKHIGIVKKKCSKSTLDAVESTRHQGLDPSAESFLELS